MGALGHLGWHVWGVVLEHDTAAGLREFAMNAMKQARSLDPLQPSMWRVHRLYSLSLALLWLLGALVDLVFTAIRAPRRVLASLALLQTLFWTLAFIPFAFVDPVIQPLIFVGGAVPLHGIAYLTLTAPAGTDTSPEAASDPETDPEADPV